MRRNSLWDHVSGVLTRPDAQVPVTSWSRLVHVPSRPVPGPTTRGPHSYSTDFLRTLGSPPPLSPLPVLSESPSSTRNPETRKPDGRPLRSLRPTIPQILQRGMSLLRDPSASPIINKSCVLFLKNTTKGRHLDGPRDTDSGRHTNTDPS